MWIATLVGAVWAASGCAPSDDDQGEAALAVDGSARWPISNSNAPDADVIADPYGPRRIGSYDFHGGIDIPAPVGTPVHVVLPGRVVNVAPWNGSPGPGNNVLVEHSGGRFTAYLHLSSIDVAEQDELQAGDVLGEVGSTGATYSHLHLTYMVGLTSPANDERKSLNPLELLPHGAGATPTVAWGDPIVVQLPVQQMRVRRVTLASATGSRSVDYADVVARGSVARDEHVQSGVYLDAGDPVSGRFPLSLALDPASFTPDRIVLEDIDGGAFTASSPGSTSGGTITVPAAADATVRQAHPTTSYGSGPLSATSVAGSAREAYLRFDVTGLPAGAMVTDARVRLHVMSDGATPDGPRLFRSASATWSENALTWNTRPGIAGAALADLDAVADLTWVDLPVTPAITGNGAVSFTLVADSPDQFAVDSRDEGGPPVLVVTYATGSCPTGIDRTLRPQPSVTRPAAGQSYVDPTFGTKVIRVTGQDGSQGGYSLWGAFGTDKVVGGRTVKNFHVRDASAAGQLYTIDTASDAITHVGPLFGANAVGCDAQDAAWSHQASEPDLLYCHSQDGKAVYRHDVGTGAFSAPLVDFTPLLSSSDVSLCQMSIDKNDRVFTFQTRDGSDCSGDPRKAIVWDRMTGQRWIQDYTAARLNETQLDKNGDILVVVNDGVTTPSYDFVDFRAPSVVTMTPAPENHGIGLGHSAPGSGVLVHEDAYHTGWDRRALPPGTPTNIVEFLKTDGSRNWTFNTHMTLNHADERYFVAETWTAIGTTGWQPWQKEILAVGMDGSWVVRLAHHHSVVREAGGQKVYEDEPRISTSYDGKYAMFTSNFDDLGRDVYILRMPALCQ